MENLEAASIFLLLETRNYWLCILALDHYERCTISFNVSLLLIELGPKCTYQCLNCCGCRTCRTKPQVAAMLTRALQNVERDCGLTPSNNIREHPPRLQ